MIIDNQLIFSDAQAITASANSTNVIDTAPLFTGNTGRRLGRGMPIYVFIIFDVGMTDAGSDSSFTVAMRTDDNAAMSSATSFPAMTTFPALTPAGFTFFSPLIVTGPNSIYERFIDLTYTVSGGNFTTCTITAGLTLDADFFYSTAPGYTTGVE